MNLKQRVDRIARDIAGEPVPDLEIVVGVDESRFFKIGINGVPAEISEGEHNRIVKRAVKAGPVDIRVSLFD